MKKRQDVLSYFKEMIGNIICLHDTHWNEKDTPTIKQLWGNECFIQEIKMNAHGVVILFKGNFEYESISQTYDFEGNFVCLTVKTTSAIITLVILYRPNIDNPSFYRKITKCYPEEYSRLLYNL